jgi:hypothetical protein
MGLDNQICYGIDDERDWVIKDDGNNKNYLFWHV